MRRVSAPSIIAVDCRLEHFRSLNITYTESGGVKTGSLDFNISNDGGTSTQTIRSCFFTQPVNLLEWDCSIHLSIAREELCECSASWSYAVLQLSLAIEPILPYIPVSWTSSYHQQLQRSRGWHICKIRSLRASIPSNNSWDIPLPRPAHISIVPGQLAHLPAHQLFQKDMDPNAHRPNP